MEQVAFVLPGAVATYSAKSALFTAAEADRGTYFESTGTFTITLSTTGMSTGWSAWFRTVSGTQTFDPSGATQINGAATYAVSNAGDVVLVEYNGTSFEVAHIQRPSTVAITGGTINNTTIGASTATTGRFTTVESTIATGTAPLIVASTTVVANLNVSQLLGATWAAPAAIGSTTPAAGTFTTLTDTGLTATRFVYADTGGTLNATPVLTFSAGAITVNLTTGQTLLTMGDNAAGTYPTLRLRAGIGKYNWQIGANDIADQSLTIGPSTATEGTTFTQAAIKIAGATGDVSMASTTASSSTTTGSLVVAGGLGIAGDIFLGDDFTMAGDTLHINNSSAIILFGSDCGLFRQGADILQTNDQFNVNISTASTSTSTGAVVISGGLGVAGNITFSGASGASLRLTTATANAAVATTLGSVGPTGSTAGDPQGWLRISVNGTDRYIPFW